MRKCKLGNIANLTVGYVGNMKAEYITEGIPFFRSLNIDRFNINDNDLMYISDEFNAQLKKSELHEGDVVVVRTGIPGTCAVVPSKYDGSNCSDLVIIRPHKGINPHFIATFINFWGQKQISNNKVGAVQQHFNVGTAKEMIIFLPYDQDSIADYLVALNEKINMNNKSIKTLESMAKTLYDYWFVQFDFPDANGRPYKASGGEMVWNEDLGREIPEGWEIRKIEEFIKPQAPIESVEKRDYLTFGKYPVIDQSKDYIAGYTNENVDALREESAVIIFGDHTRILKYVNFPFAIGADGTKRIVTSDKELMPQSLFYYSLKRIDLSTYGYARHYKFLKDSSIIVPSKDSAKKFSSKVDLWHEIISEKIHENRKLSNLRDFLLPMLMNGQVIFKS